jgi:ectoine hydroxylase-related dioxygenase (phytanoyl-CoA dioxygenase family)
MRISDEHVAHWRRHGYVVVPDLLTEAEVAATLANARRYFPTDAEYRAAPERHPNVGGWRELPFVGDALNDLATHPELVSFAERVIGTNEILVTQAILWGKYAGVDDHEQSLHADFANNTLVHPRDEGPFTQTGTIIYLSDVTDELGPTCVVSKEHTREPSSLVPRVRTRDQFPFLYEREVAVTVGAGAALLYSMSTFHRGSGFRAATGARFTFHVVFRAKESHWMGWSAWARAGLDPSLQRFIERGTPRQRELLGFPPAGHPYWNEETLAGVAARYPGMDMTPYRKALA